MKKGLFTHSLNLISAQVSLAVSGVLFWFVAARMYSVENIGLGSVLISLLSLLIFISSLGIAPTFIRFLPQEEDRGRLLGTFFVFSISFLILVCLIFLTGINIFMPKLAILRIPFYSLLFFIFALSMQLFQVLDSVFIGLKLTHLVLLKSIIQHFLRIIFLFLMVFLGGFGIFASNCSSAIVAILLSAVYFFLKYTHLKFKLGVDFSILKKILPFSLVNFLNALSLSLPGMLFPLVIYSLFSEKEAGFFYIPWMIFVVYCSFIGSINSIFLMEASYGGNIRALCRKTLFYSLLLGLAGFLTFTLLGERILLVFKKDFSQNSLLILKILFSSIFFFIINQAYITLLNIKKHIFRVGLISLLMISGIIIFSLLFISGMKSQAIAYAWLISNFLTTVYILADLAVKKVRRADIF